MIPEDLRLVENIVNSTIITDIIITDIIITVLHLNHVQRSQHSWLDHTYCKCRTQHIYSSPKSLQTDWYYYFQLLLLMFFINNNNNLHLYHFQRVWAFLIGQKYYKCRTLHACFIYLLSVFCWIFQSYRNKQKLHTTIISIRKIKKSFLKLNWLNKINNKVFPSKYMELSVRGLYCINI